MNQLFMISRSFNCDEKGSCWRENLSKRLGSISLLLMLTMLIPAISFAQDVIYTAPAPYAPAGSPCSAHRWFAGDGWRRNDNTNTVANTWEAVVVASPRLQPKGIVRCASSAEAESQLQNFKGAYNPTDFPIPSTLTDIFNMNVGSGAFTGETINGPTAGEDIVWLNFDIRPLAGTYQFQVVTNERVGWALYHVPVTQSQPQNDPIPTYTSCVSYPTVACNGRDISGDISCPNPTLVPANIFDYGTSATRGYAGLSGNGWSLITVPSFAEPTNYYLAMWMESPSVTSFPGSMNLVYKSRYGCGGSTCALELLDSSAACNNSGGKTICATFGGSYGQWFFDDVNNNGSNFTVTYYRTDGSVASTSSISDGNSITLDGGTGGIVKAKICGDFPANANYNITLFPNLSYNPPGGQNYVTCKDTAKLIGNWTPPPCTLSASASSGGNLEQITPSPFPGCSKFYTFQATVSNTTISLSTTGGGTITYGSPITLLPASSYSFNASTGIFTQLADVSGLVKFPVSSVDANGCICRDTVCVDITSICPGPFDITGPEYLCKFGTGVYSYNLPTNTASLAYIWSLIPSSAGSITPTTTGSGSSASVTSNGTSNSFYVKLLIKNLVFNQDCFSDSILVSLIDPEIGDISSSQFICKGSCASTLTGAAPTSPAGCSITYLWQSSSSCSGSWSNVSGGSTQNLSNICPSATTVYRRITTVTCGTVSCSDTSNCITISVIDPEAGDISSNQTICKGSCASNLTGGAPAASGGCSVSYVWQSSSSCSGPWSNVSGGTNQNLSNVCPAATTVYRRITAVTCSGVTCRDTSNCVTVTVIDPEAGDISSNQTICKGSCASNLTGGAPTTSGGCTVAYLWQSSSSCSGPWSNVSGGSNQNLSNVCPAATTVYRRITSVTCSGITCSDTSNCITVTVIDPEAGDISGNQTICKGSCASAITGTSVSTPGGCTVAYQWQFSSSCSGPWVNVSSNGTSSGLTPCPTFTTSYRRITSVTCNSVTCRDTSNCVTVTVIDPEAGDISSNQTICKGSCASNLTGGAPTTSGGCTVAYLWQSSSSCSGPWSNVSGGSNQNLSSVCPAATTVYRRITSVTCSGITCSDTSNCITVTVIDPEAGDISSSQTICKGSCAAPITGGTPSSSGGCTVVYTWQSASSCSGPWSTISGSGAGISGLCPVSTTSYRRIAAVTCNGITCSDTSNCITITVIDPEAGNISGTQTICSGSCPSQLTGGTPSGNAGCNVAYIWQSSATCSGPWTQVGTGQNYTPACPFNANASYRRITSVTCNGVTCYDTSNCVTVTINDVDAGSIDGDTTICNGGLPGTLTGTSGTGSGTITYEWLQSETGCNGPWTAISLSNSQNYTPGVLANTTCYVRVTSSLLNGEVCRDTSNCICVTVNICSDNCSYTQGYYGSPGKSCDGVSRYNSATDLIRNLLGVTSTPRPLTMGDPALNSFTIPGTDAAAIKLNSVLPGGKTPRALPAIGNCDFMNTACFNANILTLRGRINNVLLSQALVLTLNSRMNNDRLASFPIRKGWIVTQERTGCGQLSSPVSCSSNEGAIQSWQINESVWAFLTNGGTVNATVANLINLANKVLGGTWVPGTTPLAPANTFPVPSFSAVSGACGAFNEGFDECRSFLGYFNCPQNCDNYGLPCPAAATPMFEKVSVPVSGTREPKVEVFPNPFFDQATFVIESPVEAKASLKVYNAMGQLVSVVFQGVIPAGKSKNILFRPTVADGSLFYIYEQNGRKVTGKLIKQ